MNEHIQGVSSRSTFQTENSGGVRNYYDIIVKPSEHDDVPTHTVLIVDLTSHMQTRALERKTDLQQSNITNLQNYSAVMEREIMAPLLSCLTFLETLLLLELSPNAKSMIFRIQDFLQQVVCIA